MEEKDFELINLSIVNIFRELYPESKIEKEVNPDTGIELYKTYSIFTNNKSNLPQLYFNEDGMFGADYFCFDSGSCGYIPNILRYKFEEEHMEFPKKSIDYLMKKFNLKLKFSEMKLFLKEFNELGSNTFYDNDIWKKSLLANNPYLDNEGNWTNNYTGKWEGWSKDWMNE